MASKIVLLAIGIGIGTLLSTAIVFSQIDHARVVIERKSLNVVVDNKFPKNLSCKVYLGSFPAGMDVLGSRQSPIFEAKGKNGQIEAAYLHVGFRASIVVWRSDAGKDSYVLHMLLNGKGEVLSLFDLNLDGTWDAKQGLKKYHIWLNDKWIEVENTNRNKRGKEIRI